MHSIGLIIGREYWSRVRKRSFILLTILTPLLFATVAFVPAWLAATQKGDFKRIEVIDDSGLFRGRFESTASIGYRFIDADVDSSKRALRQGGEAFGLLYIPKIDVDRPSGIVFYSSQGPPGLSLMGDMERNIKAVVRERKIQASGIDPEVLARLKVRLEVQTISLSEAGSEQESSTGLSTAVGYVFSLLLYMFILIYSSQIMRGVMEEKTSRVIEVLVASVKPFHLMMGKIVGIAAVGLTQFLLWVVLFVGLTVGVGVAFMGDDAAPEIEQLVQSRSTTLPADAQAALLDNVTGVLTQLGQINWLLMGGCFVFYFLSGYLFYSALFSAVGAIVDSDTESQQFVLPVTMPLILSIVMMQVVVNDPQGDLAVWLSIIPFTSSVMMMMRLPFEVPVWQMVLSMGCLVAGFCATTWLAARIYRVGIFMHGTKVSYRTLAQWLTMKM